MKQFLRRLANSLVPGGSTRHLIGIAELLGAPNEVIEKMRRAAIEQAEAEFLAFVCGRCGCVVDWRATRGDVIEELAGCALPEEATVIRTLHIPNANTASRILVALSHAFDHAMTTRSLIPMESFGDAAIVLLVPREQAMRCKELASGWLIE